MSKRQQQRRNRKKKNRENKRRERTNYENTINTLISRIKGRTHISEKTITLLCRQPHNALSRILTDVLESPRTRRVLLPRPFPSQLKDLGEQLPSRPLDSYNIRNSLTLSLGLLRLYGQRIKYFVDVRNRFCNALLSNHIEDAHALLNQAVDKTGVSLWYVEAGLLLGEEGEGLKGNRGFLQEVQRDLKEKKALFLASYLTQRIESAMSVASYESTLAFLDDAYKDDADMVAIVSEIIFRLRFHTFRRFEHIVSINDAARLLSMVDVYTTFTRVLQLTAAQTSDATLAAVLLQTAEDSLDLFRDPQFSLIAHYLNPQREIAHDSLQEELFELCDRYTRADYSEVIAHASSLVALQPSVFELYELIVYSTAQIGRPLESPFPTASRAHQVLHDIHSVITRDPNTAEALQSLKKTAYVYDSTPFGSRVLGFWLTHANRRHPMGSRDFAALSSSRLTPRFSRAFEDSDTATTFLNACNTASPGNSSVALFLHLAQGTEHPHPSTSSIPAERLGQYHALSYELQGQYTEAVAHYKTVLNGAGDNPLITHTCQCGIVRCLVRHHQTEAAADAIVATYLWNEATLVGEVTDLLSEIVQHSPSESITKYNDDCTYALLLHLAFATSTLPRDYYRLYCAYDDYLNHHGVEKPSDLIGFHSAPTTASFLAFLYYVCVPEVMRESYLIASTEELELQRLTVLQYLIAKGFSRRDLCENEIADLATKAALRAAVEHVESSRIYVDVEGIRSQLTPENAERFVRFKRVDALQDDNLRQQLTVNRIDGLRQVFFYIDFGFQLFCDLFLEIRDLFVTSTTDGLDTYLSMRIRHGTLSGQLRGQFEHLQLATRRVSETGDYARNEYWCNYFKSQGADIAERVDTALRTLSRHLDEIIDEVNNVWIRTTVKDGPAAEMFNYWFSEDELFAIYRNMKMEGVETFDAFVTYAFDVLWTRTRDVLSSIRQRIRHELYPRLMTVLSDAERTIADVIADGTSTEYTNRVAQCRTNIQNDISIVAEWFTTAAQNQIQAVDINVLTTTAIDVVRKVNLGVNIVVDEHIEDAVTLDGRWLGSFVDALFILLDNVVKHSHMDAVNPTILMTVEATSLIIEVSNQLGDNVDVNDVVATIETLNALPESETGEAKLQSEGGTGFAKLHNVLQHDLKCSQYDVTCSCDEKQRRFIVRIEVDAEPFVKGSA